MAFESERLVATLFPTLQQVLLSPAAFFSSLQKTAYYKDTVLYILLLTLAGSIIGIPFASFSSLFLVPIFAFLWLGGLRLWAAIFGWAARRFAGARLTPVNAFMLVAYAFTPFLLFYAVPYFDIAAGIWSLALCAIGLVRFAQASANAAWAIVGVFFVLASPVFVIIAKGFALMPQLPQILGGRPA